MKIVVTGSTGRLGSALVRKLGAIGWTREDFDLDFPMTTALDRDNPDIVIHSAAWTDVDACAANPALSDIRNGWSVKVLSEECAKRGIRFALISTNEVFDGTKESGYAPDDNPNPINAYGKSKKLAEYESVKSYIQRLDKLAVLRTAWLYGPPGKDFPHKVVAAAEKAAAEGTSLKLVNDEWGTPTHVDDVADIVKKMVDQDCLVGFHHLVSAGVASRAEWAKAVLRYNSIDIDIEEISRTEFVRKSTPPQWGVLLQTELPDGSTLPDWRVRYD